MGVTGFLLQAQFGEACLSRSHGIRVLSFSLAGPIYVICLSGALRDFHIPVASIWVPEEQERPALVSTSQIQKQ